jgi:adenylate kinase
MGWIALTGTPGTGKSTAARRIRIAWPVFEVGALAVSLGAARGKPGRALTVDLEKLRSGFRRFRRGHPRGVLVGHLAHLLPVSYAIVLRCHPRELTRRLRSAHRPRSQVQANVLSEVLDTVLVEALERGIPVHEVDTTGRSRASVAREVERIVRRRPPARFGRVDWLADRWVTEQLLRDPR